MASQLQKLMQALQASRDLPVLARVEMVQAPLQQLIIDFEQKQTMGAQEFLQQAMDLMVPLIMLALAHVRVLTSQCVIELSAAYMIIICSQAYMSVHAL